MPRSCGPSLHWVASRCSSTGRLTLKHFAAGPNSLDHGEYVDGIGVLDLERGVIESTRELPWQTDTFIGVVLRPQRCL